MSKIRISGIIEESIVDGPGLRYTVFTQGCPHHCPGCHNPQTHDFNGGKLKDISEIADSIAENPLLSGVTISGGEPFVQPKEVLELIKEIKKRANLGIMIYSGYTFEELAEMDNPCVMEILKLADILTDGRFIEKEKDYELAYRGSRNQRVIDLKRTLAENKVILYDLTSISCYN